MPNWCSTHIEIECENKEAARGFFDQLKSWMSTEKSGVVNGFGDGWLGNIVVNSGLYKPENGEEFDPPYRCRGSMCDEFLDGSVITFYTKTAWSPMLTMWAAICDKYLGYNNYNLYFTAKEPGCELFATNDPDKVGKYCVDVYGCDDDKVEKALSDLWFVEKEDVVEGLQELFSSTIEDWDFLMKILKESEYSDNVYIYKYDEHSVFDFD